MNRLWTYVNEKDWSAVTKYKVISLIAGIPAGFAGFVLWILIRSWVFSTTDWMFCMIGCSIIFSWIAVFLYSGRHRLHDGAEK